MIGEGALVEGLAGVPANARSNAREQYAFFAPALLAAGRLDTP